MPVLDGSAVFGDADVAWAGPGLVPEPDIVLRRNAVQVTCGDNTLDGVISVRCSFGWDQPVSTCDVTLFAVPETWNYYDTVTVALTTEYLVGDYPGQAQVLHFVGVLRGWDYSQWPRSVVLHAEDELCRAQEYTNEDGDQDPDEGEPGIALADLLGTDAGGTLKEITVAVLTRCGVPLSQVDNWADPPHVYGLEAPDEFVWRFGESGLAFLHRLYEASGGYRVFGSADGDVWLAQIVGRPNETLGLALSAGRDILDGGRAKRSIDKTFNGVAIQGLDDGSGDGPLHVRVVEGNAIQPADVPVLFKVSSPMIETEAFAGELIVGYWLLEVNRELVEATIPTWRDDVMGPAQAHLVDNLPRLGTAEPLWVKSLVFDFEAHTGELTQTPTYVGGGTPDTGPAVPV